MTSFGKALSKLMENINNQKRKRDYYVAGYNMQNIQDIEYF